MTRIADQDGPRPKPRPGLWAKLLAGSHAVLKFPFQLIFTIIKRTAQILLSLFIVVLHPQFKWLVRLLTQSRLVRDYIRPFLQRLSATLYEPYFAFLRTLPPFWATVSIAVPLAVLEPAKLFATILIAERPKAGIVLWLLLQGVSVILIDKSWTAVRPQSRKIWLVSRLHAWGWLNVSYGKYWVTSSPFYQAIIRWRAEAWTRARALWFRLVRPRLRRRS
jgi:hypothetical protein